MASDPKVLLACIASSGGAYDAMKLCADRHAADAPPWIDVRFVHGDGDIAVPTTRDRAYPAAGEGLVPGVMRKLLLAFKDALAEGYDFVIQSNLSTWFDWNKLAAFVHSVPTAGLIAGNTDPSCGFWMCGCCLVMSRDVVQRVVDRHWDELWNSTDFDDVALCTALRDLKFLQIPRIDVYHGQYPGVRVHNGAKLMPDAVRDAFHVRVKSADRDADARILRHLSLLWAPTGAPANVLLQINIAQYCALVD